MIFKIAIKNIRRSIKDYTVYFLTLVLAVAIFYLFNSVYAQSVVMDLTEAGKENFKSICQMLNIFSVFTSSVFCFLIFYANSFFTKKRKKELGVYIILGMSKRYISVILFLETVFMAIIAIIVGLAVGTLSSQFMSIFTARMFGANIGHFKFIFSPKVAAITVLFFSVVFGCVTVINVVTVSKSKLIKLIYAGSSNEENKITSVKMNIFIFIISIISLVLAYILILWNGMMNINQFFLGSIIFGIVGTFTFFVSVTGIMTIRLRKNKRLYLKGLNMFVFRQFNSRINSNFISISIVCITILLTIGIFCTGISISSVFAKQLETTSPVSFTVETYENDYDLNKNMNEIRNSKNTQFAYPIDYYSDPQFIYRNIGYTDSMGNGSDRNYEANNLNIVKLSQVNNMLKTREMEAIILKDNEIALINTKSLSQKIIDKIIEAGNCSIVLDGKEMQLSSNDYEFALTNNEYSGIAVVNDRYFEEFERIMQTVNLEAKNQNKLQEEINQYDESEENIIINTSSRENIRLSTLNSKVALAYISIYLGLVFMISSAAILAIQQLSEAVDSKNKYKVLSKLGSEKSMMNKALLFQILIYFLLPLGLAIIHSIVGLIAVSNVILTFGEYNIVGSLLYTSAFVIAIYGLYFIVTYYGAKNIINKNSDY